MNVQTFAPLYAGEARSRVRAMKPGEALIYHIGELGRDAGLDVEIRRLQCVLLEAGTPSGHPIYVDEQHNKRVKASFGLGLGTLTQRRLGAGMFEYIFTRGRK